MRGPLHFGLAQQLRQLGENGSDALRLVASEQSAGLEPISKSFEEDEEAGELQVSRPGNFTAGLS